MQTISLTLAALLMAPAAASADVTSKDIFKLAREGVDGDTILTYARANRPVEKLTATDLVDLKGTGMAAPVLAKLALLQEEPYYDRRAYRYPRYHHSYGRGYRYGRGYHRYPRYHNSYGHGYRYGKRYSRNHYSYGHSYRYGSRYHGSRRSHAHVRAHRVFRHYRYFRRNHRRH